MLTPLTPVSPKSDHPSVIGTDVGGLDFCTCRLLLQIFRTFSMKITLKYELVA